MGEADVGLRFWIVLALALFYGSPSWGADACDLAPTLQQQDECRRASVPSLKGVQESRPEYGEASCRANVETAVHCCRQRIKQEDSAAFRACVRGFLLDETRESNPAGVDSEQVNRAKARNRSGNERSGR